MLRVSTIIIKGLSVIWNRHIHIIANGAPAAAEQVALAGAAAESEAAAEACEPIISVLRAVGRNNKRSVH